MSVAKIKAAASVGTETYVTVPCAELIAALEESGHCPELLANLKEQTKNDPMLRTVSVHREKHLGKLLGIPDLPLET